MNTWWRITIHSHPFRGLVEKMAINLRIFLPGYVLLLGLLCFFVEGVVAAQSLEMLLPVESPAGAVAMQKSSEEAKPYIKKVGQVRLAAARTLPLRAVANQREAVTVPQRGSTMSLAFFPREVFTIEVGGQEQPQQGVLSINGRVAGAAMSTFSMTVTKAGLPDHPAGSGRGEALSGGRRAEFRSRPSG